MCLNLVAQAPATAESTKEQLLLRFETHLQTRGRQGQPNGQRELAAQIGVPQCNLSNWTHNNLSSTKDMEVCEKVAAWLAADSSQLPKSS